MRFVTRGFYPSYICTDARGAYTFNVFDTRSDTCSTITIKLIIGRSMPQQLPAYRIIDPNANSYVFLIYI